MRPPANGSLFAIMRVAMTDSLSELLAQRESLEREIQVAQSAGRANALAEIKLLMSEHGLTPADLANKPSSEGRKPGSKVAAKYLDPETGATWSGRGLKPKWLSAAIASGKDPRDFAI